MEEVWRDVPELSSYEVSNLGNIRHSVGRHIRKPNKGQLSFLADSELKTFSHVRLTASAWLGIPLSDEVIIKYRDKNHLNLRVDNLYVEPLQLPDEIWKSIDECPDYSISNLGRVKRHRRVDIVKRGERVIAERMIDVTENDEYYEVNMRSSDVDIFRRVHRLVASAFIPDPKICQK